MTSASDVARLVFLNGGQLIGKTRLQKSAYFLETKDIGFGFDFSYYHFGPYSEELSNATDDAKALKLLDIDWRESQAGTQYAVFRSNISDGADEKNDARRRRVLSVLKNYSAVIVELAATADFLQRNGHDSDAWIETTRRKASKVNEDRISQSKRLLKELETT